MWRSITLLYFVMNLLSACCSFLSWAPKVPARQPFKEQRKQYLSPNHSWWEGLASLPNLAAPLFPSLWVGLLYTPFLGFMHGVINHPVYEQPLAPLPHCDGVGSHSHLEETCPHVHTGVRGKEGLTWFSVLNSHTHTHTHTCAPFKNLHFSFYFFEQQ